MRKQLRAPLTPIQLSSIIAFNNTTQLSSAQLSSAQLSSANTTVYYRPTYAPKSSTSGALMQITTSRLSEHDVLKLSANVG